MIARGARALQVSRIMPVSFSPAARLNSIMMNGAIGTRHSSGGRRQLSLPGRRLAGKAQSPARASIADSDPGHRNARATRVSQPPHCQCGGGWHRRQRNKLLRLACRWGRGGGSDSESESKPVSGRQGRAGSA
jgi:hypothetical protein